jgi:hypothetical protein
LIYNLLQFAVIGYVADIEAGQELCQIGNGGLMKPFGFALRIGREAGAQMIDHFRQGNTECRLDVLDRIG